MLIQTKLDAKEDENREDKVQDKEDEDDQEESSCSIGTSSSTDASRCMRDVASVGQQQCPAGNLCSTGAHCAFKLIKEVKLKQQPWAVAVGPHDGLLYVSLAPIHKILVIDPKSGAVVRAFHSRGTRVNIYVVYEQILLCVRVPY